MHTPIKCNQSLFCAPDHLSISFNSLSVSPLSRCRRVWEEHNSQADEDFARQRLQRRVSFFIHPDFYTPRIHQHFALARIVVAAASIFKGCAGRCRRPRCANRWLEREREPSAGEPAIERLLTFAERMSSAIMFISFIAFLIPPPPRDHPLFRPLFLISYNRVASPR